ncbi:MAG: class I SAM-dependent methyltransferase [Candidatus Heimdallarchaeota archaeon]|nr:class I SAM-dependent methyltransferase [Candidatus Heimdallarchaeota archaeon]
MSNYGIFLNDVIKLKGWDWSIIGDRISMEPLEWNYKSQIIPHIRSVSSLLDMGTGGGELLSTLAPLPEHTYASENYPPNYLLAKERLQPLGVEVISFKEGSRIPLPDESIDLIINKHESYVESEVYRILKPGGLFITQQVGDQDNLYLNELLDDHTPETWYEDWNLETACGRLEKEKFLIIEKKNQYPYSRFYDIGAIIFYINAIPWQFKPFDFDSLSVKLSKIHDIIQELGYLQTKSHRFFIMAQKEK